MVNKTYLFYSLILFQVFLNFALPQNVNAWEDIGKGMVNARAVAIDPSDAKIIYLGNDRGLFRSEDDGKTWRILPLTGGRVLKVNSIIFDRANSTIIYAATSYGLLRSEDKGAKWQRIFKGKNYLESFCFAVSISGGSLYLGTKKGLFCSHDNGRSWHKEPGRMKNAQVFDIICTVRNKEPIIYAVCASGVFKAMHAGAAWERVFAADTQEFLQDEPDRDESSPQDEGERSSEIRCLAIKEESGQNLYLGTRRGIYQSTDGGSSWEYFSDYGMLSREVSFLLVSEGNLYCVSRSGIFLYRNLSWEELSFDLVASQINYIALDSHRRRLYACTDKGLYRLNLGLTKGPVRSNALEGYFNGEPDIRDVQDAAVNYAEVNPKKIINWRAQAAKKAWLPVFKVGLLRDTADLWHWEGGSTVKSGDDELRRGRDSLDWDISLSWDLGEIIWNNDQTSIDVRSRLMVELRDDILDEVNKLYFERIRVKVQMDNLKIGERAKRFDKEIRLRELTASLDALTGGYFSRNLKK